MTSLTYVARIRLVKSTHLDHPLPIILIQTKATLTLLSKLTMKTPLTEARRYFHCGTSLKRFSKEKWIY